MKEEEETYLALIFLVLGSLLNYKCDIINRFLNKKERAVIWVTCFTTYAIVYKFLYYL